LLYFYFALVLACIAWFVTGGWKIQWGYWWRAVKDNPDAARKPGRGRVQLQMAPACRPFLVAIGGGFYAQFRVLYRPRSVMGFQFFASDGAAGVLAASARVGADAGPVILIPLTELTRFLSSWLRAAGVDLIVLRHADRPEPPPACKAWSGDNPTSATVQRQDDQRAVETMSRPPRRTTDEGARQFRERIRMTAPASGPHSVPIGAEHGRQRIRSETGAHHAFGVDIDTNCA